MLMKQWPWYRQQGWQDQQGITKHNGTRGTTLLQRPIDVTEVHKLASFQRCKSTIETIDYRKRKVSFHSAPTSVRRPRRNTFFRLQKWRWSASLKTQLTRWCHNGCRCALTVDTSIPHTHTQQTNEKTTSAFHDSCWGHWQGTFFDKKYKFKGKWMKQTRRGLQTVGNFTGKSAKWFNRWVNPRSWEYLTWRDQSVNVIFPDVSTDDSSYISEFSQWRNAAVGGSISETREVVFTWLGNWVAILLA